MGADNLIKFHKWHKWKQISSKCKILVFDRYQYKSKSLKSIAFKKFNKKISILSPLRGNKKNILQVCIKNNDLYNLR